jgi:ADP-ribosylation factor GTPase-activating protein 1
VSRDELVDPSIYIAHPDRPVIPFTACVDCGTPSPQWASVSYGTYVCLECSGAHRGEYPFPQLLPCSIEPVLTLPVLSALGLGVHLSFIRSLTMDKWSEDQMNKMRHGGNAPFREFMENYGPEGGYVKKQSIAEKYKTWAAAQYREKVRRGIRSSSAAG